MNKLTADFLEAALFDYRLAYTQFDGGGLDLVDALTPPDAETIELGQAEIRLLAEHLVDAIEGLSDSHEAAQ